MIRPLVVSLLVYTLLLQPLAENIPWTSSFAHHIFRSGARVNTNNVCVSSFSSCSDIAHAAVASGDFFVGRKRILHHVQGSNDTYRKKCAQEWSQTIDLELESHSKQLLERISNCRSDVSCIPVSRTSPAVRGCWKPNLLNVHSNIQHNNNEDDGDDDEDHDNDHDDGHNDDHDEDEDVTNKFSAFKNVASMKDNVGKNWRKQCSVSENFQQRSNNLKNNNDMHARSNNVKNNNGMHAHFRNINIFEEPNLDRVRCCALGVGSDAHLHIPVLMDVVIYVHVATDDEAGDGRYLLIQQGGFLRPFDASCVLWPAGYLLTQYVGASCAQWRGKTVLEIGSGVGVASITAALCGATVTTTDRELRSLALASTNAATNKAKINTIQFDWDSSHDLQTLIRHQPQGFDIVIGAACKFEGWTPNVWTRLKDLTHPNSKVVLAHTSGVLSPRTSDVLSPKTSDVLSPIISAAGLQAVDVVDSVKILGRNSWKDFEVVTLAHST